MTNWNPIEVKCGNSIFLIDHTFEKRRAMRAMSLISKWAQCLPNEPALPDDPRGVPWGRCYDNAFHVATRCGLYYWEGFLFGQDDDCLPFVMAHAWCSDGKRLIDPTAVTGNPRIAYLGVPFQLDYIQQQYEKTGWYGVIDGRPNKVMEGLYHDPMEMWLASDFYVNFVQ